MREHFVVLSRSSKPLANQITRKRVFAANAERDDHKLP
jgi:hypothetical protein